MLVPLTTSHFSGCEEVITSLPEWFGYEGALAGVVAALGSQRGIVAIEGGRLQGFVLTSPTFEETLEITYLAVHRSARRRGIGRRLVGAARDLAVDRGATSICLLTLGPSSKSAPYAETVAFYRAMGFVRQKEVALTTWGGAPALLLSARTADIA